MRVDPEVRFDRHWFIDEEGCWIWSAVTVKGYGQFQLSNRKTVRAHRFSYERWVGPIPEGMTVDHLCHDPVVCTSVPCKHRSCVNPEHLAAVTRRDNTLRGNGPTAKAARATHCPRGHEYGGANAVRKTNRECRECANLGQRRRRAERVK